MKLTKAKLKELIKEELASLQELAPAKPEKLGTDKVGTGAAVKSARETAPDVKVAGITDLERGVIEKMKNQLINAAQSTNIATGKILRYANLLFQELQKQGVSDAPPEEATPGKEVEKFVGTKIPGIEEKRRR